MVVPWQNASGSLRYLDLHATPGLVREIPEAVQWPVLEKALRHWNAAGSPIFTAKCDVWTYPADLFDAEDLPGHAFAQGSYVDLVAVAPSLYASFAAAEAQLRRWNGASRCLDVRDARCEWTLRRALLTPQDAMSESTQKNCAEDGFATTLYVWGYGPGPQQAAESWTSAMVSLIDAVLTAFVEG